MNAYLTFNGQCEEAFKFYEKTLNGKITFMLPHEGTPAEQHVPANWLKKIMHASLEVNGDLLQGADSPPDHYQKPQGFSVMLAVKDPSEAERIYQALSQSGTVRMPLQETFWALKFGMLTDRFGIPWMVNCGKPM